jgi:nucleoside-diphosphate-sugar epimerase
MATDVIVVGGGRLGKALQHSVVGRGKAPLSGRALCDAHNFNQRLEGATTVIHAAGPAGEAVCRRDPGMAFSLHYVLSERLALWAREQPDRRLIFLGTVAPDVGFYGPVKRAACRVAQRLILDMEKGEGSEQLTVVECGHVIGEGMSVHESPGVAAQFIAQAMTSGTLLVPVAPAPTIRVTPLSTLLDLVGKLCVVPGMTSPVLSPVSEPIDIRDLARRIAGIVHVMFQTECQITEDPRMGGASYADPTGEVMPVRPFSDTIMGWLRTPEVKMLFRPRSGRVLRDG